MSDKTGWIVIEDEVTTAADLETAVEAHLAKRQAALGRPSPIDFPAFGYLSPMPQPPESGAVSQTLYHHLRRLNEMPPAETGSVLQSSPATRTPALGRLWEMVREQAHQLVLFYVNREAARETAVHTHTLNVLNELTRLTQTQQDEINRLQQMVAQLQEAKTDE